MFRELTDEELIPGYILTIKKSRNEKGKCTYTVSCEESEYINHQDIILHRL